MGAKVGGGGGGRFSLGQNADINVTPFVDVLLVLLIIFMLAIPLATVSIKLDLPPPDQNSPPPKGPPAYVNVQPYGKILIGTREVTLDTLNAELAKAMNITNPADAHVDHHGGQGGEKTRPEEKPEVARPECKPAIALGSIGHRFSGVPKKG